MIPSRTFAVAGLFIASTIAAVSEAAPAASKADAQTSEAATPWFTPHRVSVAAAYQGTNTEASSYGCTTSYGVYGYEPAPASPAPGAKYPLFLYFVGTDSDPVTALDPLAADTTSTTTAAPDKVTQAMARRGYVGLSVQYDDKVTTLLADAPTKEHVLDCLFNTDQPASLLSRVCSWSNVDCGRIVTWGHSLGGAIAISALDAANYGSPSSPPKVKAAWATGVGDLGGTQLTEAERASIRLVNGANDGSNGQPATMEAVTGKSCGSTTACLRADGSGWIAVQTGQVASGQPEHCWFYANDSCPPSLTNLAGALDPDFETGTSAVSIERNANWLASMNL